MGRSGAPWKSLGAAILLVLFLSLAGLVHAGSARAGVSPHAGGTDQLTVTVGTAFAFTLSTDMVTPGDTVDLTIIQTATTDHTFTLSSAANFALDPNVNSTLSVVQFLHAHPPIVNITIPGTPQTIHATFTAPSLGEYQYLCTVSGHFQAGMYGTLGSGEHGSTAAVNNGPGAPVFIIGGSIVALVVAAIVLAFVIGRRQGAMHEMPPERLGYPETAPTDPRGHP
jgi:plastocyanin